jgi:hypothetical protein
VKLLVAVGEAVSSTEALAPGIRLLIDEASELLVMSPSEVGPIEWLTGGVDRARRRADERLAVVLGQLEEAGISASGMRGDELVPVAFEDALRDFSADHIVILLRDADRARFRRQDLIDRLLERFGLPITIVVVAK